MKGQKHRIFKFVTFRITAPDEISISFLWSDALYSYNMQ